MPALHFPAKATATPGAVRASEDSPVLMNTSDARNAMLALIAESLQAIEDAAYVAREYYKKKGLADGVFTEADVAEFDAEGDEPEGEAA